MTKIQLRRDTSANWTSANPTLSVGEVGIVTDAGSDATRVKIGDGTTAWGSLAYYVPSSGGATDLAYTAATRLLASSTGADVTLPLVGSDAGLMSAADKTKLDGVASGATANSSDATLLDRANHTGTQTAATVSDFSEAVDDRVSALLVAGTNITLTYNDGANTLTVDASGGSDPWTTVKLGSDFTTTNNTNTNVTGLAFTPSANTDYEIISMLLVETATATVGARPGISWPTGTSNGASQVFSPNSATAIAILNGVDGTTANAASTGLAVADQSYLATINALMLVGASPSGNFQITLASETAGTTVRVKAGSFIRYRAVT